MIDRLDHIGVAVRSIREARRFFEEVLGGRVVSETEVPHLKLRVLKLQVGQVVVELLESGEGEEVVRRFLEKRGEGIHHLCWRVPDLAEAQARLEAQGYRPIWPEPRIGASGRRVTFLHPRDTHGVLIELSE